MSKTTYSIDRSVGLPGQPPGGITRPLTSVASRLLYLLLPLVCIALPALAQDGAVEGVVVSEQSQRPLSGAQVAVEGTGQGTLTDADGRFRITGIEGTEVTLRVALIGYRSVSRTAAVGETDIQVALSEQAVELDAIVVTGTAGDTRRRALGNAIAQIDAADVVERQPVNTVQDLIRGRAPGVVLTSPTGMVGGGSQIRVRGISSLSLSSRPLLYVDGVRVDNAGSTGPPAQGLGISVVSRINDINPADIESIEVIKGPAAATLYGTEASNGVIQIITKRGAAGQPRFNMRVRQGANWFANAEGRIPETFWRNPGTNEVESLNIVAQENARGTPIFRTGHAQRYDLNLSGGEENVQYFLSGGYENEEGVERDNALTRWTGRANLTVTPHERVEVTGNAGYTSSNTGLNWEGSGGGVMWSTVFATPARQTLADGSPSPARGFRTSPPDVIYDAFNLSQDVGRFTGSLQFNHRPADWFSQRLNVGTDRTTESNTTLTERNEDVQFFFGTLLGSKTAGRREVENNTFDYSGTASFDLSESIASSTSFGAQYYRVMTTNVSATGEQFPAPGLTAVNAAAIQRGSEGFVENATVGVFVQQQVGLRDRLFLTGAVRADDNSAFGENFNLVYYPKASMSWVLSEEPFWPLPALNTFRLRAAYGESGQQPAAFAALRSYAPATGRGDVAAVTTSTVGNPDLGPERGKELELGFDASFLGERLGLEFTYYDQRTTDAIVLRSIAPSTGFAGSQWVNIGEMVNRGVEMMLDAHVLSRRNADWSLSLNLATNENEVLDLGTELETLVLSSQFGVESRVGFPASSFFHRRVLSAEVNADGQTLNPMCDGGPEAGGEAVPCAEAPNVYLGRTTPSLEGALSSSLTLFERLGVTAVMDFKGGHHKWDGNLWVRCSIFGACQENVNPQEADPARLAAFQRDLALQSPYISDAGFVTLRELAATYTLPPRWASRVGASNASVSVAGRNLHTWTNWPGLDPEIAFGGNWYEQNNLPQLTQFVTTVNLSF